jgi:hypothetical protein
MQDHRQLAGHRDASARRGRVAPHTCRPAFHLENPQAVDPQAVSVLQAKVFSGLSEGRLRVRLSRNPFWTGDPVEDAADALKQRLRMGGLSENTIDCALIALLQRGMTEIELPDRYDLRALAEAVPSLTVEL